MKILTTQKTFHFLKSIIEDQKSSVLFKSSNNISNTVKKSNEIALPKVQTYEQARNQALKIIGDLGPDSQPVIGRLGTSAGVGKVIGRRSSDRKVRWRLDFDHEKGPHINVEDFREGKKGNSKKYYIPFEGDENTFISLLKHLNK
ncbi:hypothetical protein ABIA50_003534 [Bacillus subtilis]